MRRPVLRDPSDLSALLEVSQTLGSTLNLRSSLTHVLEILEQSHGTLSGNVVLRDEEAGDLAVEAASGRAVEMAARTRYRLGEGITGRVVQSGRPVVVPRVSREPLFLNKTKVYKSGGGGELSFASVSGMASLFVDGQLVAEKRDPKPGPLTATLPAGEGKRTIALVVAGLGNIESGLIGRVTVRPR